MSTDRSLSVRLAPYAGLVAVGTLFAALYPRSPSTAWGALCGGLVSLALLLVLRHRRAGTLGRSAMGEADERDRLVGLQSLAAVGAASFVVCVGGMLAVVWGADALATIGVMTWVLLAVAVGAHLYHQRAL